MQFDHTALRKARELRGFSQEALAQAGGMSLKVVQRAETGKSVPAAETLATLSALLGVPMEYFFETDEAQAAIRKGLSGGYPVRKIL